MSDIAFGRDTRIARNTEIVRDTKIAWDAEIVRGTRIAGTLR